MQSCYPLNQQDTRSYPEGFDQNVFVWDIDKTYLDTHFSSMRGMARIPIEFAIDKRAIPGMPAVLRGLRRGPGPAYACAPLYFVSASPPQLRGVVERKMLMDGVEHDGIIFKDWLKVMRGLRPGRFREQLGFKLCALLSGRQNRPLCREYLFGDDVESDAEAFHLYARILAGELAAGEAEQAMKEAGVKKDDRQCIHTLLDRLGDTRGPVERVFIHLAHSTPPEHFAHLAPLVVPVTGSLQLGLALYALDLVDTTCIHQVIDEVRASLASPDIEGRLRDAVRRGLISDDRLGEIRS